MLRKSQCNKTNLEYVLDDMLNRIIDLKFDTMDFNYEEILLKMSLVNRSIRRSFLGKNDNTVTAYLEIGRASGRERV